MSVTRLLAGHPAHDPVEVWKRAMDTLAVMNAAKRTAEGRKLASFFVAEPEVADATLARYSEFDPIHVPSCMTCDAVSVPVAIAAAVDGQAACDAIWIAGAVGVRLGRAIGGVNALNKGVWPGLFAAAAIAAVADTIARRCPERVVAAALSLALSGISGRAGRPGGNPSGRWIVFGAAVAHGLTAARAAMAGTLGDAGLADGDWLSAQSPGEASDSALDGQPNDYEIGLKPAAAARQGLGAVAAFRDLLDEGLNVGDINAIEVALPPECVPVASRTFVAGNRLSEMTSLPLTLAMAALCPTRLLDIGRETPPPADVVRLAERVTITGDKELSGIEGLWPARVQVTTDAATLGKYRDRMYGDPGAAERDAVLYAKLRHFNPSWSEMPIDDLARDPDMTLAMLKSEQLRAFVMNE